jgi:hypothetical protein
MLSVYGIRFFERKAALRLTGIGEEPEFESRFLRQSHHPELSLHRDECEKSALFQRHLTNGLGTAPAA